MMDLQELTTRAREVRRRFDEVDSAERGRSWELSDIALGLTGDVGELAKLVQAKAGLRYVDDLDAKLAHELADCLWSILVIADECDVDLQSAFVRTMGEIAP